MKKTYLGLAFLATVAGLALGAQPAGADTRVQWQITIGAPYVTAHPYAVYPYGYRPPVVYHQPRHHHWRHHHGHRYYHWHRHHGQPSRAHPGYRPAPYRHGNHHGWGR